MKKNTTPGPWSVSGSDTIIGLGGTVVAECVGYSIRATDPSQRARGAREANAELIAAAPELLAACEELVAEFDSDNRDNVDSGDYPNGLPEPRTVEQCREALRTAFACDCLPTWSGERWLITEDDVAAYYAAAPFFWVQP